MSFTIFDIPDVIDSIASNLRPNELSLCVLVCKDWYHDFLPHLWRDVAVFDFDFNRYENNIQEDEEDIYGQHMAHKYSHFIRSMATQSTKSLMDLGPGCINLERLCLGHSEIHRFITTPDSNTGVFIWLEKEQEYRDQFDTTILGLLERNPNLRVVKNIPVYDKIVDALGNLPQLRELWVLERFDQRVLERRSKSLKILHVNVEPGGIIVDGGLVTHAMDVLEEVHFTDFWCMRKVFEHVISCSQLRSVAVKLDGENEVDGLEQFIKRVGTNIQDLELTCSGSFAGLPRIIASITKLRSLVIRQVPLDIPVIQAIERHHKESLEVMENIPTLTYIWTREIVDSRVNGERLEAIMSLCAQCPRLKVFSSQLISVTFEQLQESKWAAVDNITSLGFSINGLEGLHGEERKKKCDDIYGWLFKFRRLKSARVIINGPGFQSGNLYFDKNTPLGRRQFMALAK
ncbi:hypothetical protein BGX26_010449 [Mortierella sp. AD094]|nr:hypothetical protein BGX26_010449 [Mortierella sp. AD094]